MSNDKAFFIVTGAGRSGTSAVARVMHESGLRMARKMAAASEVNPEGFYEDLDVVALNERILTDVGMNDPWRPERWPSRAAVLAAGAAHRGEMAALARDAFDGWKDPRFAITLEAWLAALPSRPKVIVCLRSPRAYADSATRIYGLVKHARAMREWSRHYRKLLAIIRRHKLTATCVGYDALVEQPAETVAALARFAGRPLDASFVVPRLRREYAPVPDEYRTLYEQAAALGDARATGHRSNRPAPIEGVGGSFASLRTSSGSRVETPDYGAAVASLVARLVETKNIWESVVGMPAFELNDASGEACQTYNDLLKDAQGEIAGLVPPKRLMRMHARLRRRINNERMIAHLAFAATLSGSTHAHAVAVRAWRTHGRTPIPK